MNPNTCLRIAVFIDGAHLSKTMRHAFPGVPIAYDKLAAHVAAPGELLRTYFYDALPWVGEEATPTELEYFEKRRRFFHTLNLLPRFQVREGRCARVWNHESGQYTFEQKHVDVSLASDLVRLSAKGKIDVAVLVTGDSDFVPAVQIAKDEGVRVHLLCSPNPKETHAELLAAADERRVIDAALVEAVRLQRAA